MKLGKLPARPGAVRLKLADYISSVVAPPKYGHESLISNWGVLGNDTVGDCVLAGAGHETMLWNAEAGQQVSITSQDAISDYSAITGYNPSDPNSDQGTDMQVAAAYRKKVGIVDSRGLRHKVGAYVAIITGNTTELKIATYLFGAVGVGFQFPDYAMDQFNAGQSWHVKSGGSIVGGHYTPIIAYSPRYLYVVTWGKVQRMTWGFFRKFCDESIAYLSEEYLTGGKSLEGFDLATLTSDLAQLK